MSGLLKSEDGALIPYTFEIVMYMRLRTVFGERIFWNMGEPAEFVHVAFREKGQDRIGWIHRTDRKSVV